jgi:DNA-binding transcriptional LysR family regulator
VGYCFGFNFRVTLKQQTGIEPRKHFDVLIGGALAQADDMKDIFALRLYTRVARLGNFSAAARECGLSQSQASRIVADLETDLGTRLLSRSTRAVVPTEAGAEFLARIESILGALDEAEHSVRGRADLRGLLRMSTPTSFGMRTVIPRLAAFIEKRLGDKLVEGHRLLCLLTAHQFRAYPTIAILGTDANEIVVAAAKPLRDNAGPAEHAFVDAFNADWLSVFSEPVSVAR